MTKFKYNKYQRKWIDKLKSGKTKKAKSHLQKKGTSQRCCLGVGAIVCGESISKYYKREPLHIEDLTDLPTVIERLNLRDEGGDIVWKYVSKEWKEKIINKLGVIPDCLTVMNDGWSIFNPSFSHVEIGKFIEENPLAVFKPLTVSSECGKNKDNEVTCPTSKTNKSSGQKKGKSMSGTTVNWDEVFSVAGCQAVKDFALGNLTRADFMSLCPEARRAIKLSGGVDGARTRARKALQRRNVVLT